MKLLILGTLAGGTALAALGAVIGVLGHRADVPLGTVLMAGSALATHPEDYIQPRFVRLVRACNLIGVCLFLIGVLLLVWLAITGKRIAWASQQSRSQQAEFVQRHRDGGRT